MSNKPKKGENSDRKWVSLPTLLLKADLIRYTSDNEDRLISDSLKGSESDPESDVDLYGGIGIKDLKGAGHIIIWCCDLFCDVNKVIYLVMLSKQEEQATKGESDSEDEDKHRARKEALDHIYVIHFVLHAYCVIRDQHSKNPHMLQEGVLYSHPGDPKYQDPH